MSGELHQIYESSSGDHWSLGLHPGTDRLFVIHEANQASGGTRTTYGVEDFMARDFGSPQHLALAQLLEAARKA